MGTVGSTLAMTIRQALPVTRRHLSMFGEAQRVIQAPGLPNHFAWSMGHLALYNHRAADVLRGRGWDEPLPDEDFLRGDGTAGTAQRFDTESVCFGSTPVALAERYPSFDRCWAVFDASVERLAEAIARVDDADMHTPTRWGTAEIPRAAVATRMLGHIGMHTGQLIDLRRVLGLEPIYK